MATESSVSLTDWDIDYPVKKSALEVFHPSNRMLVYTATYSGGNDIRRAKVRILIDDTEINNGSELIVDPDLGGTNVFTFDISAIVQNYVSSVLPTLGTASGSNYSADDISVDVRISIADVSLVGSVLTTGTYRSMGSSDDIVVFKGGYDDSRIHDGDFIDTDNDGVRLRPYMSNKPLKVRATPTDNIFIGGFNNGNWNRLEIYVTTYIGASTENTYFASKNTASFNDSFYTGIGPANIEAQDPTIITDSTTHYTVRLRFSELGFIFDTDRTYTVVLDKDCNDSYTELCFLNEYGFFDYYLFRGDKIRKLKADHGYIKKPRTLSRTSTISDNLKESTGVAYDINYSISTGLVKKEVSVWLEELYTSPEVYIIENGNYFPIEVVSQSVTTEDKNKDIVNMAIEFRYVQNKR